MPRVLIVPSISSSSVVNNDSFNELYSFTETIAKLGRKAYWYVVVPPWIRDGLQAHDYIHYVHVETTRDALLNDIVGYSAHDLAAWFARRGGRHVVDAVITDCVQFSLQLSQFLTDKQRVRLPVILRDIGQSHLGKFKDKESAALVAMNMIGNRFGAMSDNHRDDVVEFLGDHVKPSLINHFIGNSFVWPLGFDFDYLARCKKTADKREKITAFCGGDPSRDGGRHILGAYRQLFALGLDAVVASTASSSRVHRGFPDRDTSYISDLNTGLTPDSYCLEAARAHLFISVAENEDTLHDEIRRIILGQVGIFPHRRFITRVLGEQYPFYYNAGNFGEAISLAEWIKDNYEEATKRTKKVARNLRKVLAKEIVFQDAWVEITDIIDASYRINKFKEGKGNKQTLFGYVRKIAEGLGDEFALKVFLDVLEEHVSWLKPWNMKGTLMILGRVKHPLPTMYDLREMLDNLGWEDTCEGPEIMMKRTASVRPGVIDG